jgi:cellulose 1,4-beta-cellobiosidase
VRNLALPGTYNTSYDLWFGKRRMTQGHADAVELMIWLNHRGACCVLRRNAPIVTIGGVRYYYQWWRPYDRGSKLSWNYLQFRRVVQTTQVTNLNLKSFVTFGEQAHPRLRQPKPLISTRWWLENVNAGYEIWNGGVGLRTTSFSARIATS